MIQQRTEDETALAVGSPNRRADELIAALAERLGGRFGAASVFGPAVEREGVTVIPVATARFGFGGGTGSDPDKRQEGEGAGAGAALNPAGYIELKDGRSRFVPIVRPERMVALVLMSFVAALAIARPVGTIRTPLRGLASMRRSR